MLSVLGKEFVTQQSAFNALSRYGGVEGWRVLEVGGNSDCAAALPFALGGAASVVVSGLYHVDVGTPVPHPSIRFDTVDALRLGEKYPAGTFDCIYGISILEHIPRPATFFREVSNALRSGGTAFLQGSPVWTGPWGHHIHLTPWQDGTQGCYQFVPSQALLEQGFRTFNPIPDWGHLLMTREDLARHLESLDVPPVDIPRIVHAVYTDDVINREPASALMEAASGCGLTILELEQDRVSVPPDTHRLLRARATGAPEDHAIMGVRMLLRKR